MADIKNLERFGFDETEEGYVLMVGAEGGESLTLAVTPDQMDAIIDALNDVLGGDEDFDDED